MRRAEEISIAIHTQNMTKWFGYLLVNDKPVKTVLGSYKAAETIKTKDGREFALPDRYELSIPPMSEGGEFIPLGTFKRKEVQTTEGIKYVIENTCVKNLDMFFALAMPISGFINEHEGFWSCKMTFNQKTYDYFTSEEYKTKAREKGFKLFDYYLEDPLSWISDDVLEELQGIYPEFQEWYLGAFPSGNGSKAIAEQRAKFAELMARARGATVEEAIPGL